MPVGGGICCHCRGSLTQHRGDPEGCWCDRCLAADAVRCLAFDPVPDAAKAKHRAGGLTAKTDSATQRAGADDISLTAGTRRREAFDAILAAGPRGVTFDELTATLSRTYSQTGPRVRELVRDGFVSKSGTRPGMSGSLQDIWVAHPPVTAPTQGLLS